MIDYKAIWESINSESQTESVKTQIARRVPSQDGFPVFLATDTRKQIRLLYIKLDSNHAFKPDNLPQFRGLEIALSVNSIGQFINSEFIKFTQSIPNTHKIFELAISDICDKVIEINDIAELHKVLVKVLNEWKLFFERQESDILSRESQLGLVGELLFLRDYLFKKYTFSESIIFWTGSERTNHDFQIGTNAVEIKTITGKQHKKITVSSEKQLDATGLDCLFLTLFTVNIHQNMPDRTLPTIINEMFSQLSDDQIATFQFQIKLAKYGYDDAFADQYTIGFSLVDSQCYQVSEGFPRLLQKDLPNGVGDIKYTVAVSACTPFELNTNILNHI